MKIRKYEKIHEQKMVNDEKSWLKIWSFLKENENDPSENGSV